MNMRCVSGLKNCIGSGLKTAPVLLYVDVIYFNLLPILLSPLMLCTTVLFNVSLRTVSAPFIVFSMQQELSFFNLLGYFK